MGEILKIIVIAILSFLGVAILLGLKETVANIKYNNRQIDGIKTTHASINLILESLYSGLLTYGTNRLWFIYKGYYEENKADFTRRYYPLIVLSKRCLCSIFVSTDTVIDVATNSITYTPTTYCELLGNKESPYHAKQVEILYAPFLTKIKNEEQAFYTMDNGEKIKTLYICKNDEELEQAFDDIDATGKKYGVCFNKEKALEIYDYFKRNDCLY